VVPRSFIRFLCTVLKEVTLILSSACVLIVVVEAYSFGNILYIILQTTNTLQRIGQFYVFVRLAENTGSNTTRVGRTTYTGSLHEGKAYPKGYMMGNRFSVPCTGQKVFFPPMRPEFRLTQVPNGLFPDGLSPGLKRRNLTLTTQLYLYPVLSFKELWMNVTTYRCMLL